MPWLHAALLAVPHRHAAVRSRRQCRESSLTVDPHPLRTVDTPARDHGIGRPRRGSRLSATKPGGEQQASRRASGRRTSTTLAFGHWVIPFSNSKISSKYGSGQKIWTPRISAGSSRIKKGQFPSRISSWECPHETFFWPGTNIFEFNRSLVWKILTTRSDCNFDLFCFLPKFWGSRVICPQL